MILVDTSIWIDHFRFINTNLIEYLNAGQVVCHPLIIGELACGSIKNRDKILSLLQDLPVVNCMEHDAVLQFINENKLWGKGMGYIDVSILSSAVLTGIPLWTLDKQLMEESKKLHAFFAPISLP